MKETKKQGLTKLERAWVLYDVGNSAFTMLACALIPIWFKNIAVGTGAGQISSDRATAIWALTAAVVTVLTAIIGPFLGVYIDGKGRKKKAFTATVVIGAFGCLVTGFTGSWIWFMALYLLSRTAYAMSQMIYDSMLADVTDNDRMDVVSSSGYGWGYIGSCAPFLIALIAYVLGPDMLGVISNTASMIIGFGVTAVWWFCVTIPLMKGYKQIHYTDKNSSSAKSLVHEFGNTVKDIFVNDKKVLFFLVSFFLYIDGVGTIIDNCVNIGTDLGLNTVGQVVTLLLTQVVAFVFSLIFAKLSQKYSAVSLIKICIVGYTIVCLYALTLHNLVGFGIMAFGVGMFQGAIQSLSRSHFTKIIPQEKTGEYFGIYDIFSKGASFLGSAVLGFVKLFGGTINVAVATLAIFFVLGYLFLYLSDKVGETCRN